jgi:hypothetical protein
LRATEVTEEESSRLRLGKRPGSIREHHESILYSREFFTTQLFENDFIMFYLIIITNHFERIDSIPSIEGIEKILSVCQKQENGIWDME